MSTDRIEKSIFLRAPRSRVWRAIATPEEFGAWFGARLEGGFTPGARVAGRITTPGYEHLNMEFTIERFDPEQLLSLRWHPYAIDPGVDRREVVDHRRTLPSSSPPTLPPIPCSSTS